MKVRLFEWGGERDYFGMDVVGFVWYFDGATQIWLSFNGEWTYDRRFSLEFLEDGGRWREHEV